MSYSLMLLHLRQAEDISLCACAGACLELWGAVCANAHAYAMYALNRLNEEKLSEKSFPEMKGDRDGKSSKRSATRYCL